MAEKLGVEGLKVEEVGHEFYTRAHAPILCHIREASEPVKGSCVLRVKATDANSVGAELREHIQVAGEMSNVGVGPEQKPFSQPY